MNIIADGNIPFVKEAFTRFGNVSVMPGREITRETVKNAEMLFVRSVTRVDKNLLDNTAVKFVGTATIGTDHIDIGYLNKKGIQFASAPGSNAQSVAEYVACALCTIFHGDRQTLSKKTIGIIGAGNVGSRVLRMAKALGLQCLVNDPPLEQSTRVKDFVSLEEILRTADIITLHVPLSLSGPYPTFHMVDETFLEKMKLGAALINSSRGKVVDEKALHRLRNKLGSVVLDVWENEPSINLQTLALADIATPHIAGYSFDGKVRGARMIFEAAAAYLKIDVSWNEAVLEEVKGPQTIDIRDAAFPLLYALQRAYPIMADDGRLRKIANKKIPSFHLDVLRIIYPKRLEFPHFIVRCSRRQADIARMLANLGFTVQFNE
jgi:erythronate-4-phosphate dehydrogenase